jgi:hypothetical protein
MVLKAVEAEGYAPTSTLYALNSYENRSLTSGSEEGSHIIAKLLPSPADGAGSRYRRSIIFFISLKTTRFLVCAPRWIFRRWK